MPESSKRPQENDAGVRRAIEALGESVRGLGVYHLNACVKCGLCGETCHVYLADPQPENLPGVKAAKVISHFRRYHTFLGKVLPRLVGAKAVTLASLDELVEAVFGRCTGCGRCGIHCSIGLDVASILRIGRRMATAGGRLPDTLARVLKTQIETGNQMAIPHDELAATAEWLSQDLQTEMNDTQAKVHVDRKGSRVLYLVNPREVKFAPLSLMAAAGVFHAAGESWTVSSKVYDVTNYGFFAADDASAAELTRRVVEEAQHLGVVEIITSECGHGFRSFRWEGPGWMKTKYPVRVRSVLELLDEYLVGRNAVSPRTCAGADFAQDGRDGISPYLGNSDGSRIKVDPSKLSERVTLHDPCNLVRCGGVIEPQRRILRKIAKDFVEMTPNRVNNYCCGGGGGMLITGEYGDRRIASGKAKADQIRKTGAKIVACPCHNCIDQITELSKEYELGVEVKTITELVYDTLATASHSPPARRL